MIMPSLQVTNANTWHSPDGLIVSSPRFVTKYELEYYDESRGATCIDGVWHELQSGSVIFCRPGQIRYSRFPYSAHFIYFEVEVHHSELESLIERVPDCSLPDLSREAIFDDIIAAVCQSSLRATVLLIELLFRIADRTPPSDERRIQVGQAEIFSAICFMKENLHRQLSISEMAAQAGYSTPHFAERFRQLTGTTPHSYFISLKLKEAKRLLLCEGRSVTETAERLSFGSTSQFCSHFKRSFSITPTEFIKNGRMIEYETGEL